MSSEELASESKWHENEAARIFEEVREMRETALGLDERAAFELLDAAAAHEAEAEAHLRQANILTSLGASRLSDNGVGLAQRTARA